MRRHHTTYLSVIVMLASLITIVFTNSSVSERHSVQAAASASNNSELLAFSPKQILTSSTEIVNPMRGLYKWRGNETVPSPNPLPQRSPDVYDRYEWSDLEPSRDKYDFSAIDRDLERAEREKRKLSLRVRALVSTEGKQVPDYMLELMEKGWWHDYDRNGSKETYVPDWNDPDFLDRVRKLLLALGARYDNDPRLSMVDVGIYGDWGEWHMWNYPYPSFSGATNMTSQNRRAIVDMHLEAFPTKYILMLTEDEQALVYALEKSPRVGWRRDSFGSTHFPKMWDDLKKNVGDEGLALVKERWKTAPVVVEFINLSHPARPSAPKVYQFGLSQVEEYHIAMISNGNTDSWESLSQDSKNAFVDMAKASGYRFDIEKIALPAMLKPGQKFSIDALWRNTGVTPAYEDWTITYKLRNKSNGAVVWEDASGLDLRTLLPTKETGAMLQAEQFLLPLGVATGTYELTVTVTDPQRYRSPLTLAIEGVQSDKSYLLGMVQVGDAQTIQSLEPQVYIPMILN